MNALRNSVSRPRMHMGMLRCSEIILVRFFETYHVFAAMRLRYMPQQKPTKLKNTMRFSIGIKVKETIDAIGQIV